MEDGTVEKLVFHLVRAGAFRAAMDVYPDAREVFRQAAEINSAKARGLAERVAMAGIAIPAARLPGRLER